MSHFAINLTAFFTTLFCLLQSFTGQYDAQEKTTVFIGHRGYSSEHVDNTEESFAAAAKKGFSGCETDVRVTADGELLLAHNSTLEYEDGTELEVATHTLAELTEKPLKNKYNKNKVYACPFARYLEVLKENGMFCFIELKSDFTNEEIDKIYQTVVDTYSLDKVSIQAMNLDRVTRFKERHPDMPLMYCAGGWDEENIEAALENGLDVDLEIYKFDPAIVARFHEKGLRVAVWTANTRRDVSYCLSLGVDFIESDTRPGLRRAK